MVVSWLLFVRIEAHFRSSNFFDKNADAKTTEGLEPQICGKESGRPNR